MEENNKERESERKCQKKERILETEREKEIRE